MKIASEIVNCIPGRGGKCKLYRHNNMDHSDRHGNSIPLCKDWGGGGQILVDPPSHPPRSIFENLTEVNHQLKYMWGRKLLSLRFVNITLQYNELLNRKKVFRLQHIKYFVGGWGLGVLQTQRQVFILQALDSQNKQTLIYLTFSKQILWVPQNIARHGHLESLSPI